MKKISISFLSPKKIELHGLWLGKSHAEIVYIFLHGLGASIFSRLSLLELIANQKNTAVLTFNNRGHGLINSFKIKKNKKECDYLLAGMAHEKFTDCQDDIDGSISYAKKQGAKKIILIGHSTGCQKIIYYLAHNQRAKIAGVILLAPMSDYAGIDKEKNEYHLALKAALSLKKEGQENNLLASSLWPHYISAQRFLSLYTPNSQEEIFSYASKKRPILMKVNQPILVILAEADEYADRPMLEIKNWFDSVLNKKKKNESIIIKKASHSFKGMDREVFKIIKFWRG